MREDGKYHDSSLCCRPIVSDVFAISFFVHRLRENVPLNCTACPKGYFSAPLPDQPRRCLLNGTVYEVEGVHCGEDVGLGSVWEANLRMPALARWPGRISPGTESMDTFSTLDIVPTILALLGHNMEQLELDGKDMSRSLQGKGNDNDIDRVLFFWRDGFSDGPLPAPYGRVDVAAMKIGRFKLWFYTRSAHLNPDQEVLHEPPLIFDVISDPAEAYPLSPENHADLIRRAKVEVSHHKDTILKALPLTLDRDGRYIPCSNPGFSCRHDKPPTAFEMQ